MMIDWERVTQLRDEVGAEDFAEVVELFLEEVEEVTERLAHSPEPARFEEDLHFLKGSALNLGFEKFSVMCQTGERLAARGDADKIDIPPILESYAASRRVFLDRIGNRAVA
jgi:HPt (histidine-containing phosphotransfer) domain-containing protein